MACSTPDIADYGLVPYYHRHRMDRVPRNSCQERFELRITSDQRRKLDWLCSWLNRSGNGVVRVAIERMYSEEQRIMLAQAGFPDGRVP